MIFRDKETLIVKIVEWNELSANEQKVFLENGYKVPEGTILGNNLDIQYEDTRKLDTS